MIKLLVLILIVSWAIFGVAFYLIMLDKVIRKKPQKVVFYFLCGPVFWLFAPFIFLMDFVSEKIFEPIYIWLTEE